MTSISTCGSPCINTGTNANLPNDSFDLFQDGNPGDSDLNPDLDSLLRTVGTTDMGAYEKPGPFCVGNIDNTGGSTNQVNIDDLLALISVWGPCPSPPATCAADIAPAPCGDGTVNIDDLLALISAWGCCPGFTCTPGDIPDEFYDCWDACSGKPDFGGCMDDCFKALCELGHTEYCD